MTKIQVRFRLLNPLDETLLERISNANAIYGIEWIRLSPSMDSVTVEYDATRLRPAEVESALESAGIALEPVLA